MTAPQFPPGDSAALQRYLAGAWGFTRSIRGAHDALQAEASGECEFSVLAPDLLRYRERGNLQMVQSARPIAFSRSFDYRFEPQGVLVSFADGERAGQPYQRYALSGNALVPVGDHLCGADCYSASYLLDSDRQFQMETWIRGPHKHSRLLTLCRRLP